MKYLLTVITSIVLLFNITGQTLVSTETENRNVILEEFTGLNCVACPSGHKVAKVVKHENPDDVYLIVHHAGYFAIPNAGQPDLRSIYGFSLLQRAGVESFPSGTINRHRFEEFILGDPEDTLATVLPKRRWPAASELVYNEESYVNVGVEADWDYVTNEITVHVEAYFTDDSPIPEEYLNIALIQDNTIAFQEGEGNNYHHDDRLVDFITPYDGDKITNTTEGSFYDKTFTYSVPDDYNGVPVEIYDMKIVAFVAGWPHEIESGSGCKITYSNVPGNDVSVVDVEKIFPNCSDKIVPMIKVRNNAGTEITNLEIEYELIGSSTATSNYQWTGSISTYEEEIITLPEIGDDLINYDEISIAIVTEDDNMANNSFSTNALSETNLPPLILDHELLTIEIRDLYDLDEINWELLDEDGDIILSGGPYLGFYPHSIATGNHDSIYVKDVVLKPESCYNLYIYDEKNNGISESGFFTIKSNGESIKTVNDFISGTRIGIQTSDLFTSTTNTNVTNNVLVYPNPALYEVKIKHGDGFDIDVYDSIGRLVFRKSNISNMERINTSSFSNDLYTFKLSNKEGASFYKILVLN